MGIDTTAIYDGGEWVLNGAKSWITNAGAANAYIVCGADSLFRTQSEHESFLRGRRGSWAFRHGGGAYRHEGLSAWNGLLLELPHTGRKPHRRGGSGLQAAEADAAAGAAGRVGDRRGHCKARAGACRGIRHEHWQVRAQSFDVSGHFLRACRHICQDGRCKERGVLRGGAIHAACAAGGCERRGGKADEHGACL